MKLLKGKRLKPVLMTGCEISGACGGSLRGGRAASSRRRAVLTLQTPCTFAVGVVVVNIGLPPAEKECGQVDLQLGGCYSPVARIRWRRPRRLEQRVPVGRCGVCLGAAGSAKLAVLRGHRLVVRAAP